MPTQVGDRVGAISSAENGRVEFYGYGIYQGYQLPDSDLNVTFFGSPLTRPNPCVLLDNGEKVYGCECWWGPEAKIKESMKAYTEIVIVSPKEQRARHNKP